MAVKAHYKVKQSKEHKIEDTAQVHKDHALITLAFPFYSTAGHQSASVIEEHSAPHVITPN